MMVEHDARAQETGVTVRSVTPVGRDAQEFTVAFVADEANPLTLTATVVVEFGLRPGKHLDASDLGTLRHADVRQRATEAAMRYLGLRPRSTQEIRDYLLRKGFMPETVAVAIERLVERGYLDDAAFAQWWAENRAQFRPRGPHLLRQELRKKGITSETIDETLTAQAESVDTDAQALELARGKLRSFHKNGLEPDVIYRRLSGLLGRRGYGYDTIRTVMRTLRDNGELASPDALDALGESDG